MEQWLVGNWFNIIGTVFGSGLWFTAFSIRKEAKTRKEETKARQFGNSLTLTANHRELWKVFLNDKELARVRSATANTTKQPITDKERVFVNMLIHHINSAFYGMHDQLVVEMEGLRRDIVQIFSLPIPYEVWEKNKVFQNNDFVTFVESCRNWK